ncbi:MAG: DUF882 domain-containing protein [Bacteroidales bacterium]|nr:DUF882 domain-containing protein [Candidatus Minthousia equi]
MSQRVNEWRRRDAELSVDCSPLSVVNRVSETPVVLSSGYRCPQLNAAVGGAKSSQHMKGEAADIHIPSVEVGRKWFEILKTLPHDQLIWERNSPTSNHYWIHVSCRADLSKNRGQCIPLLNKYSA